MVQQRITTESLSLKNVIGVHYTVDLPVPHKQNNQFCIQNDFLQTFFSIDSVSNPLYNLKPAFRNTIYSLLEL